jgi:hypothetical protein
LAERLDPIAGLNPIAERPDSEPRFLVKRNVGEHRHASHALDAGGDHNVLHAGHYRLGRELHCLL